MDDAFSSFAYVARGLRSRTCRGAQALEVLLVPTSNGPRICHGLRRDPRHDDQPVSLLLAGGAGDRGGEANPRQAALRRAEERRRRSSKRIRHDTLIGMAFSTIISVCDRLCDRRDAPRPRHHRRSRRRRRRRRRLAAGRRALRFRACSPLGIIGTGLLAVPVLAGSAAYAVTEMLGMPASLDAKPLNARFFYAVIAVTTLAGASLQSVGVNPVQARSTGARWSTACSLRR